MNISVRAESLGFSYQRGQMIVDDVNLSVAEGSITGITGPSGRGKSTLLYLFGLLLTPTAGDIWVADTPVRTISDAERSRLRAEKYGFVFQDAALDPARSVLENVLEPILYKAKRSRESVSRAHELLERFGVEARAAARPGQISGGQAQRIALCRAIVGRPSILIADEPTGNLDAAAASVVLDAFREQANAGVSVIIATHDQLVTASCDRIVQL